MSGEESDVAIIPVNDEQSKLLAQSFNGWPTAVMHKTGAYFLEDWDVTEAVYTFTTHITADGETFQVPANGMLPVVPTQPQPPA